MMNAKAVFDKGGNIKFEKLKWKVPIEALTKVTLQEKSDKYYVVLFSDKERQNSVLVEHNLPKIRKNERKFTFSDITTCRDFIFNLKRIYHLHNCGGLENTTPPLLVEVKK